MSYKDRIQGMKSTDTLAALTAQIEKGTKGGGFEKDKRYYVAKTKEDGTASVTFRFLPNPDTENNWVKFANVSIKLNGKYYINRSPRDLGLPCPIYDWNGEAYKEFGKEAGWKAITARGSNFKYRYVSNILIIKDELQPDAVGQVFLFEYGNEIFNKIQACTVVDEDDDTKAVFDPFNPFSGANFLLKLKTKDKFVKNQEDSKFLTPSALFGGDEEQIIEACDRAYPVLPEIDASKYKSYDDLAKQLALVRGEAGPSAEKESVDTGKTVNKAREVAKEKPVAKEKDDAPTLTKSSSDFFGDDDSDSDLPF
jgi:hypothetical protein